MGFKHAMHIWHTGTHITTPNSKRRKKKSLTGVPLAPVCCTRRGGHPSRMLFCPHKITKWEGGGGRQHNNSRPKTPPITTTPAHHASSCRLSLHTHASPWQKMLHKRSHTHIFKQINSRTSTHSNAECFQEPRPPRNTRMCMYGPMLHQCLASEYWGWQWRGREKRKRVERTTGCCWAREEGDWRRRGWSEGMGERVCRKEEGTQGGQMIMSLWVYECVCVCVCRARRLMFL